MIFVIVILFVLLALASYKIFSDRRHITNISEQLKIALYKNDRFVIKESGINKAQNELIEQINIMNDTWREMEAKYHRSTQQSKEMISSITHDFRTPLTSMLGYIQILQEMPDSKTQLRYLKIIESRTQSLNKLVDDFYDVSILDSDDYPIYISKINPKIILQEQLAMYYDDLNNHFNNVIINIDDSPIICHSDIKALNRIYSNLIKNALTHGINNFEVNSSVSNNILNLTISNGIKDKEYINLNKLFDRTFRNDATRNINSTGLGLSIAKELASLINSSLSVSQENQTIHFNISIPIL